MRGTISLSIDVGWYRDESRYDGAMVEGLTITPWLPKVVRLRGTMVGWLSRWLAAAPTKGIFLILLEDHLMLKR